MNVWADIKLSIPYGDRVMSLALEDRESIRTVSPQHFPADEDSVMRSLTNHTDSGLESFLSKRDRILVVINDHTRPLATTALEKLPLKGKDVTTLIATGTHREPTPKELARLLGGDIPPYGGRVVIHDATNKESKSIGRTTRGTEVCLNSQVFDADGLIVIGSVEPHYYAGFTGGRKFLLPGLASFKSIEMNHSLALDDNARILSLGGNPVHEDFMDALRMFGRNEDIFSIQLVMNPEHRISFASSGDIVNSFTDAVQHALRTYVCPVPFKADILIAIVNPPLDIDLYQAHKAIENVKPALNDDGILILLAQCRDGIGNRFFYDLLASKQEPSGILREHYTFGGHKALRITQLLQRARIFAITDLDSEVMRTISITPFADLQSAVNTALTLKGNDATITLVNDAGVTVPMPRRELK